MPITMCRSCRRPLLDENSGRNIFDDDSLIKSFDCEGSYDKKWYMKLSVGIELITGQKVSKEDTLPQKICEICFQNVEAYINFRFQILRSRDILLSSQQETKVIESKLVETKNSQHTETPTSKSTTNEPINNLLESNSTPNKTCNSPLMSKTSILQQKAVSEDLINVDESSTSLDVSSLHNEDGETNDSLTCRLQNDQENNNFNDSDSTVDNAVVGNMEEIDIKQPDHDIESEIDVCSGEDDDVLELDVQRAKNETVEIESSSESDIEVCDYEPTGKRGNYNVWHEKKGTAQV